MSRATIRVFRDAKGRIPIASWWRELEEREPKIFAVVLETLRLLEERGYMLDRPHRGFLEDGVFELRPRNPVDKRNFRILYFFYGQGKACLSHGTTKEKRVPLKAIDLAKQHMTLVKKDHAKHTAPLEAIYET